MTNCTRLHCLALATGRVLVPTHPNPGAGAWDTLSAPLCDPHQVEMCLGLRRGGERNTIGNPLRYGRPFAVPLDHEERTAQARASGQEKSGEQPHLIRREVDAQSLPNLRMLAVERRAEGRIQSYRRFFPAGLFAGDPEGCWAELEKEAIEAWKEQP